MALLSAWGFTGADDVGVLMFLGLAETSSGTIESSLPENKNIKESATNETTRTGSKNRR